MQPRAHRWRPATGSRMDCPSCAAKIENAARKMEGVGEVKVSIASQVMTLSVADPPTQLSAVEQAVTERAARLVRRR